MNMPPEDGNDVFRVIGILTVWALMFGGGVYFLMTVMGVRLLPALFVVTASMKGIHHLLAGKLGEMRRK